MSGSWTARRGLRSRANDDARPYGAAILLIVLTAFAVGPLATIAESAVSPDQVAVLIAAACVLARGSVWTFDTVGACASVALFGHTAGEPLFAVLAPVLTAIFLAAVLAGRAFGPAQRVPRFLAWFGALDVLAFVLSPAGADLRLEFHTPRLVVPLLVTMLLGGLAGLAPRLALSALAILVPLATLATDSAAGGWQTVALGATVVFLVGYFSLALIAQLFLGRPSRLGR